VSGTLAAALTPGWSRFLTNLAQLARRPLLVNLRTLLERIPFRPLDVNCLYFLEFAGVPPPHANYQRGRAEVRRATLDDLEGLTKCQNAPSAFRRRFAANDQCAVAVLDGRIIGYQWYCARPVYLEERYSYGLKIPPDAIYEYDIFILPEHRLAGLWFKFHGVYLRELMTRLSRRTIIGMVDYGNRLSMSTHLRFGFKLVRRVLVVQIFGKSFFVTKALDGSRAALPRWLPAAENTVSGGPERRKLTPALAAAYPANASKRS
jgi:hypothetical protein